MIDELLTDDLDGALLDAWVARAQGLCDIRVTNAGRTPVCVARWVDRSAAQPYSPSTDWTQAHLGSEEWLRVVGTVTRRPAEKVKAMHPPLFQKTVDPAGVEAVVARMKRNRMIEAGYDAHGLLYRTALRGT